jgi:hypothetical protein
MNARSICAARTADAAASTDLTVHVATMDGEWVPEHYPTGPYTLRLYNQGRPAPSPAFATLVNLASRGLARSRNAALASELPGIFVVTDNDVRFMPGFERTILDAYARCPDADVILFEIRTPHGRPFGRYPIGPRRLGALGVLHRCSIEITFRTDAVRRAGLRFDERFGLGARHPTGEDIIFLQDALDAGLRVWSVPQCIAEHPAASSGAAHDRALFGDKAAMFVRMHGWAGVPMALAYAVRKRRACRPPLGLIDALRAALQGAVRFMGSRSA